MTKIDKYPPFYFRGIILCLQYFALQCIDRSFTDTPLGKYAMQSFLEWWSTYVQHKSYAPLVGLSYLGTAQIACFFSKTIPFYLLSRFSELSVYYALLQTVALKLASLAMPIDACLMHCSIFLAWHTVFFVRCYPQCTVSPVNVNASMSLFYCAGFVPCLIYCTSGKMELQHQFQGWILAEAVDNLHYLLWKDKYEIRI